MLDRNPEVKSIRIKGSFVVNKVLAASLQEMGFKPTVKPRHSPLNLLLFGIKGMPAGYTKLLSSAIGQDVVNPYTTIVKVLSTLGYLAYDFRPFKVNDWTLEIPVR